MDIKIFMCCHDKIGITPPLCTAIQCGCDLAPRLEGTVPDNIGDNISSMNRQYCELTAHYYAWKNVDADYYGFCHYRRFFAFNSNSDMPYIILDKSDKAITEALGTAEQAGEIISGADAVVVRSEDMGIPVWEHYCGARHHYAEDLANFEKILKQSHNELSGAAESYLSQRRQYFCNMFVMSRRYFFEYCNALFGILSEFDEIKTLHGDYRSDRTDGYLGEIFTGIFINYAKKCGASVCEVPRVDIDCSLKKTAGYYLFPPESGRRFAVKRFVKAVCGNG